MKRPNFEPILEKKDYVEKSISKPIETFIPSQAMDLKELVRRFESGQRLNVHQNFRAGSNFTDGKVIQEDFEDAPPDDVHDVVDVQDYYRDHRERKTDYENKMKEKAKKEKEAKQPPTDAPTPPDPAA